MKKAFQIAIEGSDGAGKATQTTLLEQKLIELGYRVARISFPRYTDTWAGKLIHEALKSERAKSYDFLHASPQAASLLYAADRLESISVISELSTQNDVLIYDRAVASNLIHQGGKLASDKERLDFLDFIERTEYQAGFPRPDMTIFLSLPFEISMSRAKVRAEKKGEQSDIFESDYEYMQRSHSSGVFYAHQCDWTIIDAVQGGKELNPEEIFDILLYQIQKHLPKK